MLGGFDIQRHPLQRRTIVGMGLQASVDQRVALRLAAEPYRRGDKALHQEALRRADIRFKHRNALFAQQLFQPLQLAMLTTVKTEDRAAAKILQRQRLQAHLTLVAQQRFHLRLIVARNKGDRLLRRQRQTLRAAVRRQPENDFGALGAVAPVAGKQESCAGRIHIGSRRKNSQSISWLFIQCARRAFVNIALQFLP